VKNDLRVGKDMLKNERLREKTYLQIKSQKFKLTVIFPILGHFAKSTTAQMDEVSNRVKMAVNSSQK
jgi:protoheme ferro-lyase